MEEGGGAMRRMDDGTARGIHHEKDTSVYERKERGAISMHRRGMSRGDRGRRSILTKETTNREECDDDDDGCHEAAAPQGPYLLDLINAAVAVAAAGRRRPRTTRQYRRIGACCWIAGRRRKRRRYAECSAGIDNVSECIVTPAPGAVMARGWALTGSGENKLPRQPVLGAFGPEAGSRTALGVERLSGLRGIQNRTGRCGNALRVCDVGP